MDKHLEAVDLRESACMDGRNASILIPTELRRNKVVEIDHLAEQRHS